MAKHAPGKHFRNRLSILEVTRMFPNDEAAEEWIAQCRLGDTPACLNCGSENVQTGAKHPSQHYHCRETDAPTLQGFVHETTCDGTTVYTDEAGAYRGLENHETVKHSVGQWGWPTRTGSRASGAC